MAIAESIRNEAAAELAALEAATESLSLQQLADELQAHACHSVACDLTGRGFMLTKFVSLDELRRELAVARFLEGLMAPEEPITPEQREAARAALAADGYVPRAS
jgi:hypothetical protein